MNFTNLINDDQESVKVLQSTSNKLISKLGNNEKNEYIDSFVDIENKTDDQLLLCPVIEEIPNYQFIKQPYLKIQNALSEFNTENLKNKAITNLGIREFITNSETELVAFIQGNSKNNRASTDPFVNLGNMRKIRDLVAYAETIIEDNKGEVDAALSTAMISGVYRAFISTSLYEMKLNVFVSKGVLTQTITGVLNLTDGVLSAGTTDVITVERYFQNGNGWSGWKIVASAEKLKELFNKIISLEARIKVLEEYHNGITANVADNNLSLTGEGNVVDGNLNVVGSNVTIVDNNLIIE